MRVKGLEPPCLAAPDPKSGASANFATLALNSRTISKLLIHLYSGLAETRTRTVGFGGSRTIHYTTRPKKFKRKYKNEERPAQITHQDKTLF